MATLDKVYDEALQLNYDDQLSLLGKLTENIRRAIPWQDNGRHTLLPLAGLGAEVWAGVDVDDYIKRSENGSR